MLNKIKFDKADKVLYEEMLPSGLKYIGAPMLPDVKKGLLGIYVNVGGLARNYSIGKQRIFPGTANLVVEALLKKHPKESDPLFEKGVKITCSVEESYTSFVVSAPKEKCLDLVLPLFNLVNQLLINNDEAENLKKDYLEKGMNIHDGALEEKFRKALYITSPMKDSFSGDKESISNIHYVSMKKFFNTFYGVENLTFFSVGDINPDKVDEIAKGFRFAKKEEQGEISIKSIGEDYSRVNNLHVDDPKKGRFGFAIKMPLRKDVFDKYNDRAFAYYELLPFVLFSKNNSIASKYLTHILALKERGMRQGGEDAFFYQEFEVTSKDEMKADLDRYLSAKKIVSYFDFRKIRKEYLLTMQKIYKTEPETYMKRLFEAFANSLADLSLTEENARASYNRFNKFLTDVLSLPRTYLY